MQQPGKPPAGSLIDRAHPLARGLRAYWPFLERGGRAVQNVHGFQYPGTFQGDALWEGGKFGGAVSLDGTGDYVQTTFAPQGFSAISVSVWCRLDAAGNYPMVASYGTNADDNPEMRFYSTTGQIEWIRRSNNVGVQDTVNLAGTGWHHFVGTADGTTLILYKDGQSLGSAAQVTGINSATSMRLGRRSDDEGGAFELDGMLDNVLIYDRVLSALEVMQLYADPFGLFGRRGILLMHRAFVPQVAFIPKIMMY